MTKIDLRSPIGNANCLLIVACRVAHKRGMSDDAVRSLLKDMRKGDYAHLLTVMQDQLPGEFEFASDPRARHTWAPEDHIDQPDSPELVDLLDPFFFFSELQGLAARGLLA